MFGNKKLFFMKFTLTLVFAFNGSILYRVHYRPTLAKKTYLVGLALGGPDVSGLPITMSCKKYRVAELICSKSQSE